MPLGRRRTPGLEFSERSVQLGRTKALAETEQREELRRTPASRSASKQTRVRMCSMPGLRSWRHSLNFSRHAMERQLERCVPTDAVRVAIIRALSHAKGSRLCRYPGINRLCVIDGLTGHRAVIDASNGVVITVLPRLKVPFLKRLRDRRRRKRVHGSRLRKGRAKKERRAAHYAGTRLRLTEKPPLFAQLKIISQKKALEAAGKRHASLSADGKQQHNDNLW